MSFDQPAYSVSESDIVVNPMLHISKPFPRYFSVSVYATDGSATGEPICSL